MSAIDSSSVAQRLRQPADPNVFVWHYMTLGRFVWLLLYKQLWMAPLDRLSDKFEGIAPGTVAHELMTSRDLSGYGFDAAVDRASALHQIRRRMFVSCWHVSPYESSPMWAAFGSHDGVVIRTTYRRLQHSVGGLPVGLVEYRDFGAYRGAYEPIAGAWLKRSAFSAEQEARVGLYTGWLHNPPSVEAGEILYGMPIEWSPTIIDQVRVYPRADFDHIRAVTDLVKRLAPECADPLVAYSSLASAPPY